MPDDRDSILEEAMWRGAIHERSGAEAAVEATLEALARCLSPADAAALAEGLPPALGAMLARRGSPGSAELEGLYQRLASIERISLGLAVEHVRAVCDALAHALGADRRLMLQRRLPPAWAALFAWGESAPPADHPGGTGAGHGHTLATGRPGSRHPLSEARPRSAQADSVVTSVNPHADTKLSSGAPSLDADQLSTGRPGAEHPLSEAKDEKPPR